MKWTTALAISLGLLLSQCGGNVSAQDVPVVPCHGYEATAHTGDFSLTVCRADDNEAIDEAILLTTRVTGSPAYIEVVTVVYQP